MTTWGPPLTRRESDEVLRDLALVLPRSNPGDVQRMLDLHFGLLSRAGVTGRMLRGASERFVMLPTNGRSKFFPDPGQLAEMCADEIKDRRRAELAVKKALELIDAPLAPEPKYASASFIEKLTQRFRIHPRKPSPAVMQERARAAFAGRAETDAGELRASLQKRMGAT